MHNIAWCKRIYESIEISQNPIRWMQAGTCPHLPPRLDRGESTEVLPQRYRPGALVASKLETCPGKEFEHRSKALPHSVVCCVELCWNPFSWGTRGTGSNCTVVLRCSGCGTVSKVNVLPMADTVASRCWSYWRTVFASMVFSFDRRPILLEVHEFQRCPL